MAALEQRFCPCEIPKHPLYYNCLLHRIIDLHYVSKPKTGEDTIDEDTEEVDDAATELFKVYIPLTTTLVRDV